MLILTLLKERVWSFSYFIFQINVEYHHTPAPAGQRASATPPAERQKILIGYLATQRTQCFE